MTNFSDEEIIEMAKQAGCIEPYPVTKQQLITFARLIQEKQIEVDAGICDFHCADYTREGAEVCADAIRGQK
jgi:hypothetical protein